MPSILTKIHHFLFRTKVEVRLLTKDDDGKIVEAENLHFDGWVAMESCRDTHKLQPHGGSLYRAIPKDFVSAIADENGVCVGGIRKVFDTKTQREFLIMPDPLKGGDKQE